MRSNVWRTAGQDLPAKLCKATQFKGLIKEICDIVDGPVNAEVVSTDAKGMIAEAKDLAKIADNIVVKIPLIKEGLEGRQAALGRWDQDQCHALFFPCSGVDGCQGRRCLHQPLCRQAG